MSSWHLCLYLSYIHLTLVNHHRQCRRWHIHCITKEEPEERKRERKSKSTTNQHPGTGQLQLTVLAILWPADSRHVQWAWWFPMQRWPLYLIIIHCNPTGDSSRHAWSLSPCCIWSWAAWFYIMSTGYSPREQSCIHHDILLVRNGSFAWLHSTIHWILLQVCCWCIIQTPRGD